MSDRTKNSSNDVILPVLRATALALVLSLGLRGLMPRSTDFLCYWTAGKLITTGYSPYNPDAQTRVQRELGWDKNTQGGGRYDFLPYYCPPWLALFCAPFTLISYENAEKVWFSINLEFLILSTILLKKTAGRIPGIAPEAVVFMFFPTLVALWAGQISPAILLAICVAWWLIDQGRDGVAGALLACLTVKPQISALLLAGVMIWATRRRRWGVVVGFGGGLGLLCLVCTAILPSWPAEMLHATRLTPLPTDFWPWVGASWTLALRTLGVHGKLLWVAYALVAVPITVSTLRVAWDRRRPLRDVLAMASFGAFFISPYAQLYDFPILVIPLLILLGHRLPRRGGLALLTAFLVIPFAHAILLSRASTHGYYSIYLDKYLMMMMPVILAACWLVTGLTGLSRPAPRVAAGGRSILHHAVASRERTP